MQQDLGHWHPDLWPLQVQLQQKVSAALAQHTEESRGQRDWVTGMVWPVEGHVLKEPFPGDSSHLQQGDTVGSQVPVPPLLDAAG